MIDVLRSPIRGWLRLRFQILGCIFVAGVVPYLARRYLGPPAATDQLDLTLLASVLAMTFGAWLAREVGNYPGVEASSYILPSFCASYGLAVLVLLLGRIDYARFILLSGFIGGIIWFFFIHLRFQSRRTLKMGLIPLGAVAGVRALPGIQWREMADPSADFTNLQAVVADLRYDMPDAWDRRLADFALAGVPVYHCKHLAESMTGRIELEHLSENSFGTLSPTSTYMSFKRVADWLIAAVAMLIMLPFFFVVAIAVRVDSPGPALFRQVRVGYRGRPFQVYKFRTMKVAPSGQDERASAMTLAGDKRITRLGRFLRQSRIDELPQMLNVLRGEMSLIGPRPEAQVLSKWYETEIPFYRYRHIVRPGITGWAQVNQGHVADVHEVTTKLQYDFFYIKNFSPWLDLLIVVQTIRTMLTGHGAK